MYEIKVKTSFSAAHNLRNYRGNCENVHGHNWKVKVSAAFSRLDNGIAMDFRELKKIAGEVVEELDHVNINSLDYFKELNPTSENVARYIYEKISDRGVPVKEIAVSETDDYIAVYRKE